MDADNKPNWLDRVYQSSFYRIGTVIGLGVALFTAPLAFPPIQNAIFPRQPQMAVQIQRESPAFDVSRQFSGLSVIYKGQDLVASKYDLLITQVKIINTGSTSISETNISRSDPLGVKVANGQVLGIIGFSASSDHLRRRASPQISGNVVSLPSNIIFDPEDYVGFDLLILKKSEVKVGFSAIGKVEGVKEIYLDRHDATRQETPILSKAFGGGFAVQSIRIIVYTIFSLILAAFFVGIAEQVGGIRNQFKKRRRKKICARARDLNHDIPREEWILISSLYLNHGAFGLKSLRNAMSKRAEDGREEVAPFPMRKDESIPAYLMRAFKKSVVPWELARYIIEVANNAGIKLSDPEQEAVIRSAIERFERSLDEVAAEVGVSRASLEGRSSAEFTILTDLETSEDFFEMQRSLKSKAQDQS